MAGCCHCFFWFFCNRRENLLICNFDVLSQDVQRSSFRRGSRWPHRCSSWLPHIADASRTVALGDKSFDLRFTAFHSRWRLWGCAS